MRMANCRTIAARAGVMLGLSALLGSHIEAQGNAGPGRRMTFRTIAIGKPETPVGQIQLSGYKWQQSSARLPISIQHAEIGDKGQVWRFEVNRGQNEVAPGPTAVHYAMRDRSELWMLGAAPGRFEKFVCLQYDLNIDQMPSAAGQWNVLGQWHAVEDPGDPHLSPVLAFEYDAGEARVVTRSDPNPVQTANPPAITRWSDDTYPLHQWVNWKFEVHFSRGSGDGALRVWQDSKEVVALNDIPIGYNDRLQPRFQFGIYRGNNVTGRAVAYYSNVSVKSSRCS